MFKKNNKTIWEKLCEVFDIKYHDDWIEVAAKLCRMDDGLPARMDGLELTKSAHRRERLKALGNAIVPQVAIEIMSSIKMSKL